MKTSPCKHCGSALHSSFQCFTQRKPIKTKTRVKRIGPVTKKWIETRADWIAKNPGPWNCYICHKKLDLSSLTLDHVIPRSRRPDLRFDHANLKPCCWADNTKKGSRVLL